MQDNTQNNWKIVLEDPDNFPAETIRNKNEAWEKLYSKLHKKLQPKLFAWYWSAACFLVIAIGAVMIFVSKEKHQPELFTDSSPVKVQIPVGKETTVSSEQKNTEYKLSQPKQKRHTIVSASKNNRMNTIQSVNKNLITDSIIKQLPQLVNTSNPLYDSINKGIVAATPARKKLKVVHLNEIGQPAVEPTVNNRFLEKRGFELKIMKSETYNPVSGSSANNGLILTKPRNTSN